MTAGPPPRMIAIVGCLFAVGTLVQLAARDQPVSRGAAQADLHAVTYFIAEGDPAAGYVPADHELAAWAFVAWERNAAGGLHVEPSRAADALVRLYWASDRTTYGEMREVFVKGRRGAEVFVRPDITAFGADIASRGSQDPLWRDTIVYLTCLHELGHAFGLPHTADDRDIMYSFRYGGDIVEYFARYRRRLTARNDIPSHSGLSDADVRHLRALHPPW